MKLTDYLPALRDAGERLAEAAERAGLDAEVPSCPGWAVRDLVFHTGGVHRWAATHVRDPRERDDVVQHGGDPLQDAAQRPPDDELLDWFRAGHGALLATLEKAPPDLECWTFLPAPSSLEFWARRQTHETTIHRVDADLAAGEVTPVDPQVAVDGIDELLAGFVARRRGRLRSERRKTLSVQATDTGTSWLLAISDDPVVVTRDPGTAADATVRGPAAEVYLALWNRRSLGSLDAFGDAELLGSWREQVRVRW